MSRAAGNAGFGRWRAGRIGVALVGLLALSCASSSELARRSDESLKAGHTQHGYDWARKALDKDPKNDVARANLTAAAVILSADSKRRIRNLAASDSTAAAEASLEFARFRAELARYEVVLDPDATYREDERRIREAAAAQYYRSGRAYLDQRQPKAAYRSFLNAGRFVPGYRDLPTLIPSTYNRALTRVAVLPFANQTEVPGLSRELADRMYRALDDHLTPNRFQFTRLVSADQTYGGVTVGELDRMDRDAAIHVAHQLGAQLVVWGRYAGLTSDSDTHHYHQTIFRHVVDPDIHAQERDHYAEFDFSAVTREREVRVRYEFEILDADAEVPVAHHADEARAAANTVFTDFQASGDCDDYCLLPPAIRERDRSRAEQLDQQWEQTFGHWTLPKLLDKAHEAPTRSRYRREYRDEFFRASYIFPVFLDDLPSANDLAVLALDGTWKPLLDALQQLDGQDLGTASAAGSIDR